MGMKRTNLVLDAQLLERAREELGARTYSATVNLGLAELLRLRQVQRLAEFQGSHAWQGDLAEMREDRPPRPRKRAPARGRR
jgi:Arc/MetJ family transcription regulator